MVGVRFVHPANCARFTFQPTAFQCQLHSIVRCDFLRVVFSVPLPSLGVSSKSLRIIPANVFVCPQLFWVLGPIRLSVHKHTAPTLPK